MEQDRKASILLTAKEHLGQTQVKIDTEIRKTESVKKRAEEELKAESDLPETQVIQGTLLAYSKSHLDELAKLRPSPYFTRCDIKFDDEAAEQSLYFAKFSFGEESIFSWTTPVASLRFEEPGRVVYETPEEGARPGTLLRKDQYMIVDGKIIFLASESKQYARELIYQEYLSSRKNSFVLPEIVAQMEKAQDQVIRAHHAGPFVISGPAGSGKTTLALHRVAFLTQSPETSRIYPSRSIIVFVQDAGTREYFSHLLPELGIHNVRITTFTEWALEVLSLEAEAVNRIGKDEEERDQYEYSKLSAIRTNKLPAQGRLSCYAWLELLYKESFNETQASLFRQQQLGKTLDRYDLTALLLAEHASGDGLTQMQTVTKQLKNGRTKRESKRLPVEFSLMVVDEFQNYLPQQLRLLASCLRKASRSILYVGDLAQQTRFGTIRDWSEVGEVAQPDRTVRLAKVYRNTRKILQYIRAQGYTVEIPEGIREGVDVVEVSFPNCSEEIRYIAKLADENPTQSIGVLAKDPGYLDDFLKHFSNKEQIHCLGIREAQGVEFDLVCLVGSHGDTTTNYDSGSTFSEERQRIDRDLHYVALTRAISELYVFT